MMRASFGSAMRHMLRKITTPRMSPTSSSSTIAPMTLPAMDNSTFPIDSSPCPSGRADNHGARWEVLDHDDAGALADGLLGVGGVGVKGLAAASNRHHDLAQPAGADKARHAPDPTDHLLVKHRSHHSSTKEREERISRSRRRARVSGGSSEPSEATGC